MGKCRADALEGKMKLLQSVITPTPLYGAHLWGLLYLDKLDIIQTEYLKRILSLPRSTNKAAIRHETRVTQIALEIFKRAWNWIIQLLSMKDTRLAKICLLRQIQLHLNTNISAKLSWITQFNDILSSIDMLDMLRNTNIEVWKRNAKIAFDK